MLVRRTVTKYFFLCTLLPGFFGCGGVAPNGGDSTASVVTTPNFGDVAVSNDAGKKDATKDAVADATSDAAVKVDAVADGDDGYVDAQDMEDTVDTPSRRGGLDAEDALEINVSDAMADDADAAGEPDEAAADVGSDAAEPPDIAADSIICPPSCDDGDPCTDDACVAGLCTHSKSPACVCETGVCCDNGKWKPGGTVCENKIAVTEYTCSADGKSVTIRTGKPGCVGGGPACSSAPSALVWSAWSNFLACKVGDKCSVEDKTKPGVCVKANACDAGSICCTPAGTWAAKGSVCGTDAMAIEYKCDGGNAMVRKKFSGCTGIGATCSADVTVAAFSDWFAYENCVAPKTCIAAAKNTSSPSCAVAPPADLCGKIDAYDAAETTAASIKLGAFADTDHGILLAPKVLLNSATDKDFFQYNIADNTNLNNPAVFVQWTAQKPVTVCAFYRCVKGPNSQDCDKVSCAQGQTSTSNSAVSGVAGNGCCLKSATGTLSWGPVVPGLFNLDETGTVFFSVKNEDAACQEVAVHIAFGGAVETICDPVATCCAASGKWAASGTACGAVTKSEFQCSKVGAGGAVQTRSGTGTCGGSSATCSATPVVFSPWTAVTGCLGSEECSVSDPQKIGQCKSLLVGSCAGACGGQSKNGVCYCDAACANLGDCCLDKAAKCP